MADLMRSPRMAGALVRKARLAQGLTQKELAARMNVRQATISKLESGESATRMAVLFDALAALGLELVATTRSSKSGFEDMF
jgi:HTH-type transcriptional regulator/antitoxin HipB